MLDDATPDPTVLVLVVAFRVDTLPAASYAAMVYE